MNMVVKFSEADTQIPVKFENLQMAGGTGDHAALANRDAPDQHPMSAITGLEKALAAAGGGGIVLSGTAEAGQTIVVKTIDEAGQPTQWEAVDMPDGNSGAMVLLYDFVTESDLTKITLYKLPDGMPMNLTELELLFYTPNPLTTSSTIYFYLSNQGHYWFGLTTPANDPSAYPTAHMEWRKGSGFAKFDHATYNNVTTALYTDSRPASHFSDNVTSVNIQSVYIPAGSRVILWGR